jgi:hypothetical protein
VSRRGWRKKALPHATCGPKGRELPGQVAAGSAPAVIPGGQKHPGLLPALTVRAAGRGRSWSRVPWCRSTRPCSGEQAHDEGCSAGSSRAGHCAIFAHADSGPCGPVRFCPRAHGASAPGTVPLAGWVPQAQPTECAETAGSVRGAVVHAVCPCSLTVAEVGRRRRLGVATFGCGCKWNRPS